jgi:uncharacterized protein (DUF736 family)
MKALHARPLVVWCRRIPRHRRRHLEPGISFMLCAACEPLRAFCWRITPQDAVASRPGLSTAANDLLPRRPKGPASARNNKIALCRPPLRCGPGGCRSAVPGLRDAIKAAMVAGLKQQTEIIMAQIGSFTRGEDGMFNGTIRTLSLNVKARLIPMDASSNEKAPGLRVLVGNVEIGAAWRRTSKENTEYHSVKLDDPSFPAPIYANLIEGDSEYTLVWSR